jgi:hypothetical protein
MKLIGVLIVLLSCWACAGRRQADVSNVSPDPGSDVTVVRRLLQHADAAVRIPELCGSKAGRPELKQGCATGFDAVTEAEYSIANLGTQLVGPAKEFVRIA